MPHWIRSLIIAVACVAGCFARLARDRKIRQAGTAAPVTRRTSPSAALPIFLVPWGVCAYFIWYIHSRGFPQSFLFLGMFAFLSVMVVVIVYSLIRQRRLSA